jgi:hypothetical protein
MNNKDLFQLACRCLSLDIHPEFDLDIIKSLADENNRQNFVGFCSNQLILPTICLKFRSHNLLKYFPEEFTSFLEEVHQLNLMRNEQILKQLREIMRILNEQKIYPTLLKGAGNLLDNLYSDRGERMMGDIDFLVSEKDYLLSAELMENAGYVKFVETSEYKDVRKMKHYPRLHHPNYVATIEIHRIPVVESCKNWFNPQVIDSEKKTVPSLDGCFVESDKHKIIHNFIHSQISNNGYLYGSVPIRDLYDLFLYSKRFSLTDTIPHIKNKRKAIAYYAFAKSMFKLDELFFQGKNLAYHILNCRHHLNHSSALGHKIQRSLVFLYIQIFHKYAVQLLKSIYSGEMRRSLVSRMGSRQWYNDHLNWYLKFFRRKVKND